MPAGAHITTPARGVDLAPTLADLAGVPWSWPEHVDGDDKSLGCSLAPSILGTFEQDRRDRLTFTTYNVFDLGVYPADGPSLWRLAARRADDRWLLWDGVAGEGRACRPSGRPSPPSEGDAAMFQALEAERLRAVSAAATDLGTGGLDPDLQRRLSALGYLG